MSTLVEFLPVTEAVIQHVAKNMRQLDKDEIWASSRSLPEECLKRSVEISDFCTTLSMNGIAVAIFGLVRDNTLIGAGVPWILGTDDIDRYVKSYIQAGHMVVREMLKVCPTLVNFVYVDNHRSIRFLKALGFTIDDPILLGGTGEMFHPFRMEGDQCVNQLQ